LKIAVTGASGFIGKHVLRDLQHQNIDVVAVTRNAAKLKGFETFARIIEMDISYPNPDSFDRMGCPDVLIHLAWDGLPNYKSLHHFETELPRQYNFLKSMIDGGLSSLLVAGTCFEYGMQSGPLSEELTTRPNNPYGYAKDTLRKQLEFLKSNKPFSLTWARLFYMYGEGQPNTSLYPKLKEAVLRGDKVFDMSGGEQLRDYLTITEVAGRIAELALTKNNKQEVINICSAKPISVRSLVERWILENKWEIELNFGKYPYPDYEPMAFWGSSNYFNTPQESH
jgi:nucleoside-diphosphate-sugar epimerase